MIILLLHNILIVVLKKVYDHPIILDNSIILSHEPMFMNDNMPYFNIYGHVHDKAEFKDRTENSWCVSVERINYTPAELVNGRGARARIEAFSRKENIYGIIENYE